MGSHFRVNPTTPVTFTFTLPPVSVTKITPSWWNRLRKQPFVDWIVKLMASTLIKELFKRVLTGVNSGGTPSGPMTARYGIARFGSAKISSTRSSATLYRSI